MQNSKNIIELYRLGKFCMDISDLRKAYLEHIKEQGAGTLTQISNFANEKHRMNMAVLMSSYIFNFIVKQLNILSLYYIYDDEVIYDQYIL